MIHIGGSLNKALSIWRGLGFEQWEFRLIIGVVQVEAQVYKEIIQTNAYKFWEVTKKHQWFVDKREDKLVVRSLRNSFMGLNSWVKLGT